MTKKIYVQGSPFKFTHMLTLKQNQDYDKVASKHPEDKKCHFNVILEWEWTIMRHLRPYWPQTASEFEVKFKYA